MGLSIFTRGLILIKTLLMRLFFLKPHPPVEALIQYHPVHTENMVFCLGVTNSDDFIDLSERHHALEKNGTVLLSTAGLDIDGLNGVAAGGLTVPDLTLRAYQDYTLMAVISAKNIMLDSAEHNVVFIGDYKTGNASTLVGVKSVASGDTRKLVFRVVYGASNRSNPASASNLISDVDVPASLIVDNGDGTVNITTSLIVASLSSSESDNAGSICFYLPSYQLEAMTDRAFAAADEKRVFTVEGKSLAQSSGLNPVTIGFVHDTFSSATHKTIKTARIDAVSLTAQQIEDQYQATKSLLLAEGAVDISHWR